MTDQDLDAFDALPSFTATTEDGRYGLDAKNQLWRIVHPTLGYMVGNVMDAENLEYAAEMADEEMRVLVAEAREEFGLSQEGA